jgi:hypothetical protein
MWLNKVDLGCGNFGKFVRNGIIYNDSFSIINKLNLVRTNAML